VRLTKTLAGCLETGQRLPICQQQWSKWLQAAASEL
jgi:hypothetical protein